MVHFALPDDLLRIVLLYEGSILKAYIIALIRRLSVRTYQGILSRHFHFYGLERYCVPHLIRLVQTEVLCVQRFAGESTTRVFRKTVQPWLPWIHRLKLRRVLHTMVRDRLFCYPAGHPLFRVQSVFTSTWLYDQCVCILGVAGNNNIPSIQKFLHFKDVEQTGRNQCS